MRYIAEILENRRSGKTWTKIGRRTKEEARRQYETSREISPDCFSGFRLKDAATMRVVFEYYDET